MIYVIILRDFERDENRMILAIFDLDHTLTKRESLLLFFRFVRGELRFLGGLVRLLPAIARYALKQIDNQRLKQAFFQEYLGQWERSTVTALGERFVARYLPGMLRSQAVERLRWHQAQGHRTLIVSASPELYVRPLAQQLGMDGGLGTRLVVVAGRLTGEIDGANCYGAEKVRRLRAWLGDVEPDEIYAYGDSRGDRELLAIATHPYYRCFGP
jgi:HAD superfamily hydrolase (TIGR01490 family)